MKVDKIHYYDWTLRSTNAALCGIDIFTLRLTSTSECNDVTCIKCRGKLAKLEALRKLAGEA